MFHASLLLCSCHFLSDFVTEQTMVKPFLFVKMLINVNASISPHKVIYYCLQDDWELWRRIERNKEHDRHPVSTICYSRQDEYVLLCGLLCCVYSVCSSFQSSIINIFSTKLAQDLFSVPCPHLEDWARDTLPLWVYLTLFLATDIPATHDVKCISLHPLLLQALLGEYRISCCFHFFNGPRASILLVQQ